MMDNEVLKALFIQYKEMTENIIEKFDNNVNVDGILTERGKLLEKINEINTSGKVKEKIYKELGLDILDEKLGDKINKSLLDVKNEIRMNKLRQKTNNSYNNVMKQNSLFSRRV